MSDEQSTIKFLLSKESRGLLIGMIALIAVVIAVGWFSYNSLFGSDESQQRPDQAEQSSAQSGESSIKAERENIKTNVTSPELNAEAREALDQYNDQASEEGFMPVPTPDNVEMVPAVPGLQEQNTSNSEAQPSNVATKNDERRERQASRKLTPEQVEAERDRRQAAFRAIDEHRRARLEAGASLIATYDQPPVNDSVTYKSGNSGTGNGQDLPRVERNNDGTASYVNEDGRSGGKGCEAPLIKGGEIRFAQTDIALNTDFRGPVRMTFLDGKIAGYTGMGTFDLNEFGAKMKLTINTLFDPDGQRYDVKGYVLDPETTLWAQSSDVDRHIIYRYGGFGLGTILSSFAVLADNRAKQSEITTPEGAQSTVYREPDGKQVTWTLLGEFSRLFEEAFKDNLDRPITVTLDPDEEAGVLFEDTICELDTEITRKREAAQLKAKRGFSDPVVP